MSSCLSRILDTVSITILSDNFPRNEDSESEEESSENETEEPVAEDELGSDLMTDEFDNLGQAEVTVNRAPAAINSIDPKEQII